MYMYGDIKLSMYPHECNNQNELGIRFSEAIELLLLEHEAHLIIVTELLNL